MFHVLYVSTERGALGQSFGYTMHDSMYADARLADPLSLRV